MSAQDFATCIKCPFVQKPPHVGSCRCTLDDKEILDHIKFRYCPESRFGTNVKPDGWDLLPVITPGMPVPQPPWGPERWREFHIWTISAKESDAEWLDEFAQRLPCGECRVSWMDLVSQHPPEWDRLVDWGIEMHNRVNQKLGRTVISLERGREIVFESAQVSVRRVPSDTQTLPE